MSSETCSGEKGVKWFAKEREDSVEDEDDSSDENMPVNPQLGIYENIFEKD